MMNAQTQRCRNQAAAKSVTQFPAAFLLRYGVSAFICLMCMFGCSVTKVPQAVPQELFANDDDAQLEFWHTLADKPLTSNDEAFHGLLLYLDGADPAGSYDERVRILKERRMLPSGFDGAADDAVSRGDLAVAIVRALDIKGGLTMRVFGPSPRYAVRELTYQALYPPSSPQQTFSGAEFVGIIGRIEDYQRGNPADVPAEVLPGEMEQDAGVTDDDAGT